MIRVDVCKNRNVFMVMWGLRGHGDSYANVRRHACIHSPYVASPQLRTSYGHYTLALAWFRFRQRLQPQRVVPPLGDQLTDVRISSKLPRKQCFLVLCEGSQIQRTAFRICLRGLAPVWPLDRLVPVYVRHLFLNDIL